MLSKQPRRDAERREGEFEPFLDEPRTISNAKSIAFVAGRKLRSDPQSNALNLPTFRFSEPTSSKKKKSDAHLRNENIREWNGRGSERREGGEEIRVGHHSIEIVFDIERNESK